MTKKVVNISESQLRGMIGKILSEVVDELNLYHGTNADFDKFDVAYMSTGWGKQAHGYGFYLIDNYDAAKEYAYDNKNGQVMEVEVPDGLYLDNGGISMKEKQNIASRLFKYLTVENEDTRESYEDEDSRRCLWEYEIKSILGCADGEWVYGTVSSILGEDSETSKFLHDKCGYVGLKLLDRDTKDTMYVIFDQNDIKILRKMRNDVIQEEIEKINDDSNDLSAGQRATDWSVGKFGVFRLSNHMLSCIYEAAFQLLGFERFAIDGEITFGGIMDNPWDDAYAIINWAVSKGKLGKKYLGRVSSLFSSLSDDQFRDYRDRVSNGQEFMFDREDLAEIFKVLPDKLRVELFKDVINAGRIGKVHEMVEYLKKMNGGRNLEAFIEIMKNEFRNGNIQRGNIANLREPVRKAMVGSRMIGSGN